MSIKQQEACMKRAEREETTMASILSRLIAAPLAMVFAAVRAAAQTDYPRRPIALIVPFAAGGPTDVIARIAADNMTRTLGQPIIIENIVGAGGTPASARAGAAAPDGYTIEMGHMGTHAASVALYPNLAYKPDVDFAPIGMVAGTPILILAKKDFPAKDLKEFVSYVKANVDKLNMAHAGARTAEAGARLRWIRCIHDLPVAQLDPGGEADVDPVQRHGPGIDRLD